MQEKVRPRHTAEPNEASPSLSACGGVQKGGGDPAYMRPRGAASRQLPPPRTAQLESGNLAVRLRRCPQVLVDGW